MHDLLPNDDKEEEGGWKCLMQFLDGSPSFCNGFSSGQMWEQLKQGPDIWESNVTVSNQDQALMIAGKMGYRVVEIKPSQDGEWTWLKLARQ